MTISLARGIPAPECLPVEELADCAREAIRRDGHTILSYGSTLGYEPLREWIAERHGVEPGRVLVTNGSLQAFHFVLALIGEGRVIVERPTYDRPRAIMQAEGREFSAVGIDAEGLDLDELEQVCSEGSPPALRLHDPDVPEPERSDPLRGAAPRLASFAQERSLPVLEDDPYGLVRFEGEPLPSLFELEGGNVVMYGSSFSKTVAPGLRVGYAIVPPELASELVPLAASTYITPALAAQATLYEFLRRGLFEANVERVCGLLRERRDAMLETLESELGGRATWSRPEGGYFLWLELPEDVDAAELLERSSEAGVTFVPGADFGGAPNTARLAFSYVSPDEIEEGVRLLGGLLAASPAAVELG